MAAPRAPQARPARLGPLRLLAASTGVAVLIAVACTEASDPPGPRPPSVDAEGFTTRWPIKHVVFLIKENRSFDHMFGAFPGANGASFGMLNGRKVALKPTTDQRMPHDLPHDYPATLQAWNEGKMDGFDVTDWMRRLAYTQLRPEQIPNYWSWASDYVLADNFFASAQGPSFPNHLYAIAAQSGGTHDNPVQTPKADRIRKEKGLPKSWGCDAVEGVYVEVVDAEGQVIRVDPCFDFETEGDLLSEADIPW